MHNKQVVIFWNKGSILHAIICIYILYEFCIQIVYIIFTMYTFCRSELMSLCIQNLYKMYPTFWQTFVYKMYTKCIQNVYLQNVSHISTNFCIQNVYKMYTKCLFTKCIPHFDKLLYTKCVQNFWGLWVSFVTRDEFSARVTKITSGIGVSLTHKPPFYFWPFYT